MINHSFFPKAGPFSLKEIADLIQAEIQGNESLVVDDIGQLHEAQANHLSFYHNPKFLDNFQKSAAGAIICEPEQASHAPKSASLILSKTPYRDYAKIASLFYPLSSTAPHVSDKASIHHTVKLGTDVSIGDFVVIEENVEIGNGTQIGAGSYIGKGVRIGHNCVLSPQVTLQYCVLGNSVHLKPGVRIGQRGFGFDMDAKGPFDVPQLGVVYIEDGVEVGANTCIDRGSQSDTVIGKGSRIDNLVQIAHNVKLGQNCILVAQVGIAGSTKLGNFVVAGGQVGISEHLTIGDGARFAGQSGVMRDVPAKTDMAGSPCVPVREWHKQTIALKRLTSK